MQNEVQPTAETIPRTCDSEPIHIPGSIQPHGLMLLFNAENEELAYWAGDVKQRLGFTPVVGSDAATLLGAPLAELIGSRLLDARDEAVHVGSIRPGVQPALGMMAHRTGHYVVIELQETTDETSAAFALGQVQAISQRIGASITLAAACDSAAALVRSITGFDRVMVYQFLDDSSGSVIAESRSAGTIGYLNHRFPASDIPKQARDLYRRNLLRTIPDVDYQPAGITPAPSSPIDMSHSVLRSVSPVHIQYLKNMDVGASMSVSLIVEGELWGLIACHHPRPTVVSFETQLLCRHIATSLSAFVLSFRQAEGARLQTVQTAALELVLTGIRSSSDPERRLRTASEELKQLIDCGGFVLLDHGELMAGAGEFPGAEELNELSVLVEAELQGRKSYSTDRLGEAFGSAPAITACASGVLAVRLHAWRPLLALWLRPEQIEEVTWAGDPRAKVGSSDYPKALTPRRSFATWRELVRGRSRKWLQHEIYAVELFRTRVGYAMQRHRLKELNLELNEANALLNALATTDPLTGLPNRRLFDQRLQAEWERVMRQGGSLGIVAIDIDHFKQYNDCFGHPAGDDCLKHVATAIEASGRAIDTTARLGGEEFAMLLPDVDAKGAAGAAERVRNAVERLALDHPKNEGGVVTISVGVALGSPSECTRPSELMATVDRALYEAKAAGRNRVAVSA